MPPKLSPTQLDSKLEALRDHVHAHLVELASVSKRTLKAVFAKRKNYMDFFYTNSSTPMEGILQRLSSAMARKRWLCSCAIVTAAAIHILLRLESDVNQTAAAARESFIYADLVAVAAVEKPHCCKGCQ